MQIVIDIPKEYYEALKAIPSEQLTADMLLIKYGKVLPEGHGRLIDADKLDEAMYHESFETDTDMQKWDSGCWIRYKMFERKMEETPTVVEADKELKAGIDTFRGKTT